MFFDPTFRRGEDGDLCGAFVGSEDTELLAYLRDVLGKHPEIAEVLDHKEASNRLGIEVVKNGYWLSASGWMHPPSICKNLLGRPGISSTLDCGKVTVRRQDDMWIVKKLIHSLKTSDDGIDYRVPDTDNWCRMRKANDKRGFFKTDCYS